MSFKFVLFYNICIDQEIKLRLSSLSFVKRRIDMRMVSLVKLANRIPSNNSSNHLNKNQAGFSAISLVRLYI